jgi:hypothetical protein
MPKSNAPEPQLDMVPIRDYAETYSMEKNLVRIGFFSAAERGGKSIERRETLRRVQINVYPDGRQEQRMITFNGSLGLPNTNDLDKWVAFMRIVDDTRRRLGYVPNPIRFRGYTMLKLLKLTASGANYDALNEWGQRMVATSILSKSVVWFPKSRRYADKALTVFQEFSRTGKQDSSGRAEEFQVMLTEWLLEGLTSEYTFSEDYSPYLQLRRNIAKAMYGPLWMWFSTTKGAPFQKDYIELSNFLGIKPHSEFSRIKTQLSNSLDELVAIDYLSGWDILKRAMEMNRWKVVMHAGPALLTSLGRQKSRLNGPGANTLLLESSREELSVGEEESLTPEVSNALHELLDLGVTKIAAQQYIRENAPGRIFGLIEYASYKSVERHSTIRDRTAFLCYLLNTGATVPNNFVSTREKEVLKAANEREEKRRSAEAALKVEYESWGRREAEDALTSMYPGPELEKKISAMVEYLTKTDAKFAKVPAVHRPDAARAALVSEMFSQIELPPFDEWYKENAQRDLFNNQ